MKSNPLPGTFPFRPTIIFTDVDDTLTWEGKLPQEAFAAMFKLQQQGIKLIPVTGACAGWCDCIVRTWPVSSIIGENGAFYLERDANGSYIYIHALAKQQRRQNWHQLQSLKQRVLDNFNQAKSTADQAFRLNDIAFDIGQDHKVDRRVAVEIAEYCRSQGANAKISSIHINVWQGMYSKSLTALNWLKCHDIDHENTIFIGDSPNDEDMFTSFNTTVGVANIKPLLDELTTPPTYITSRFGGHGFAEFAKTIL